MICVLFDLDGTLTDSGEGIKKSIQYALTEVGREPLDEDTLRLFIGPPLIESFQEYCGMTESEAYETTMIFRERYERIGKYENAVYDGIEQVLISLRKTGAYVGIATAKPEHQAIDIIKHFKLDQYFDVIKGADYEIGRIHKDVILEAAIKEMEVVTEQKYKISKTYMVGDRCYDMEAAKKYNCVALGVLYGFGTKEELEDSGADYICEIPTDILLNIMVDSLV